MATATEHAPVEMVFSHRNNQKHKHVSAMGSIRYCNHWFRVYRCPVCGKTACRQKRPIICRGYETT
jgi:hypothetical protein